MSLLNVWVSAERALIAVDTDGVTRDGARFSMSKLLPLVHARTVLAARGDRVFLFDLFSRFYLGSGEIGYDEIVRELPNLLASQILGYRQTGLDPFDYQFTVVGWSSAQSRVCGRWYVGRTDVDDLDVNELGSRVAPWQNQEAPKVPDSAENIRWLAEHQTAYLQSEGAAGGGRLLVAEITKEEVMIRDLGTL